MNDRHVFLVTGISILITLLFPPFELVGNGGASINEGYKFILSSSREQVNVDLLITQWLGIILIAVSAYLFLKKQG